MKLILRKKEKNYMEFHVEDRDETLLIPLRNQLLVDEAVEFANYNVKHPGLDMPEFYIKVASGKPQNALKKASKALSNTYKEMLQQFQKQS
jgi:DNA-directed RNA polymerase subunit L